MGKEKAEREKQKCHRKKSTVREKEKEEINRNNKEKEEINRNNKEKEAEHLHISKKSSNFARKIV